MSDVLDMESGAALQGLVNRELKRMEQQPRNRKPAPQQRELSDAQVVAQLVNAAMPAVASDAKSLQRIKAENEIQRRKDESAWARERAAEAARATLAEY